MHPGPADPFDPDRLVEGPASFKQALEEFQALADMWRAERVARDRGRDDRRSAARYVR